MQRAEELNEIEQQLTMEAPSKEKENCKIFFSI